MKLYLLSCEKIQPYAERILPLLPEQRQLAYARTHSGLALGAGILLASVLHVHRDEDLVFGPQGKPFLVDNQPEFSLSHSGAHVLLGVIDGCEMDLQQARYADFEALARYCHLVAGVVGEAAARIFAPCSDATIAYAHRLGLALQLTNIIRDVGEDVRRGRIYSPCPCRRTPWRRCGRCRPAALPPSRRPAYRTRRHWKRVGQMPTRRRAGPAAGWLKA